MRAILFAAVIVLLGVNGHAKADERCRTVQEVIKYFEAYDPTTRHIIYRGADANGIKAGIVALGANGLDGERVFVVFSWPGRDVIMIAGFDAGCFEAKAEITRRQLDEWLAGKGVQK